MVDLAKLTKSISDHEGLRNIPYTDSTGHITVGFGTNLNVGITNAEAEYLRDNRIQTAISEAETQPWWNKVSDNDARSNAVVECIFNLGLNKFNEFTKAIAALNAGDFPTCSAEMLNSLWASQVGRRAEKLASMIISGNFCEETPAT